MASDVPHLSESSDFSDDLRTRKNLRSSVVTDNDPLKIKLKISKRDIIEPIKTKREDPEEMKNSKSCRSSSVGRAEDQEENVNVEIRGSEEESKMKLRSKRETEDDGEQGREGSDDGIEEKRKKVQKALEEISNDPTDLLERPVKKRGRPSKLQIEENEKLEERRRLKRLEMEARGEKNVYDGKESFCWACHKDGSVVKCDTCPRVFHLKCVSLSKDPSKDWICPECSLVLHAEKMSTRSEAMKNLSLDQLCTLLNFAIGRMKNVPESQAFWKPVDPKEVPYYDKYITNPMDLNLLDKNIKAKMYGSPQAFLADAKWLLHNSIIFNSTQSPLTSTARFLVKICKQEMAEIENCPDCYLNAHTKKEWFVEVCRKPHILIWARLKGFPFWPAKAMSTNLKTQSVDARFFGAHDKAWVPVKECYLYSKNSPQLTTKKRTDLDDAFIEVDAYIKKIKQKYGTFCYAADKTPFMPEMYDVQLQSMIPSYQEEKTPKKKRKKQIAGENGVMEKIMHTGKKLVEHSAQHRFKLKQTNSEDSGKMQEDICLMNDYVSDEKVLAEDGISPEDEVAQSLEMYDTGGRVIRDTVDENSTDLEEDGSVPIPEHGYSRSFDTENDSAPVSNMENEDDIGQVMREVSSEVEKVENVGDTTVENEVEVAEESSEGKKEESPETVTRKQSGKDPESQQCVVSSTSTDKEESESSFLLENCSSNNAKRKSEENEKEAPPKKMYVQDVSTVDKSLKQGDEKTYKSFTNLSADQKQKILTEAKLLASIDEMSPVRKQKILNDLGLDASQVDITQLAQENRMILETLTKNGQSETSEMENIPIKSEDFEQYLMEEQNQEPEMMESERDESIMPTQECSIKVKNIETLSKESSLEGNKIECEPVLNTVAIELKKDLKSNKKELRLQKKSSSEDNSKKVQLEPVIELIKLDDSDKSLQKLNRKLRLSDEVSLLMVEKEKKTNSDGVEEDSFEKLPMKRMDRRPRARKSMPNGTRHRNILPGNPSSHVSPHINVISVDTENSSAQKNLLRSLCTDERKIDEDNVTKKNKKTVLITTNDKGIGNVDVTTNDEGIKKSGNELTLNCFSKGSESPKDNVTLNPQKNLTVVANSHLILTNNGPTLLTNQNATNGPTFITNHTNQGNLAIAQNNLGQLSLVHLTNLTSGIQTNFVSLTNDTIGLNNSIGTIYTASPSFGAEGVSVSAAGNEPVFISSSTTNATISLSSSSPSGNASISKQSAKTFSETNKVTASRGNGSKPVSGISVRSPASLGLVTNQSSKLPPVTKTGEDVVGEVGSVTAELNRHSVKMAEYMRATIEDILRELSNQGSLEAKYKSLAIEMEKLQWRHQQEIMELKHHSERSLMELRTTLESEKQKCLAELKSQLEARHQKIISETKNKQWCANCGKEALFYCCWNTSYCDYPCQQQHWPSHMSRCAQLGNNVQSSNQLQNKNPGLKYQSGNYVPMMSRAGASQSSGPFPGNRSIPTVQAQSQGRRSSDPPAQVPINITIRPQHFFM